MVKNEEQKKVPDLVPIFLPKEFKGDDEQLLSINGRRLLVQKGKTVMVPPEFAELVENSMRQKQSAEDYINAHERV